MVGADDELRKQLISHYYNEAIGAHSGVHVTTKKISVVSYWKGLMKMVKQSVSDYDVFQR